MAGVFERMVRLETSFSRNVRRENSLRIVSHYLLPCLLSLFLAGACGGTGTTEEENKKPTLPTLPNLDASPSTSIAGEELPPRLGPPPSDLGPGFKNISANIDSPVNMVVSEGNTRTNELPERSVANLGDLNGDGIPEIIFANMNWEPQSRANQVFTFDPVTEELLFSEELTKGVASLTGFATGVIDLDGDGWNDILASGTPYSILYGGETEPFKTSLSYPPSPAQAEEMRPQGAMHFADIDRDGWLDILLGEGQCEAGSSTMHLLLNDGPRSYSNRGDLLSPLSPNGSPYVVYAGPMAHVEMALFAGGGACSNADPNEPIYIQEGFTEDGFPLFEAVDVTPMNAVYKDTPEVSFGPLTMGRPMGAVNADFNGDGTLDFLVTLSKHYALFEGLQDWPMADQTGITSIIAKDTDTGEKMIPWGALPMDVDHDGRLDLIITHGSGDSLDFLDGPLAMGPQHTGVYWSAGHFYFEEITEITGLMEWGNWRALVQGDLNRDGLPDLTIGGLGRLPSIYINRTKTSGKSVGIQLQGTTSNHLGMGTRVSRVTSEDTLMSTQVMGGVATPLGVSEPLLFFGLPEGTPGDFLVTWPTGIQQRFNGLSGEQIHTLMEPPSIQVTPKSRRCPEGETCSFTIQVLPRNEFGALGDSDVVTIEQAFGKGTWQGPAEKMEDGSWVRYLDSAAEAGTAVIEVNIEGTVLGIRPRLWWGE